MGQRLVDVLAGMDGWRGMKANVIDGWILNGLIALLMLAARVFQIKSQPGAKTHARQAMATSVFRRSISVAVVLHMKPLLWAKCTSDSRST